MEGVSELKREAQKARSELKNIRQQLETLKRVHQKDVTSIRELLKHHNKEDSSCFKACQDKHTKKKLLDTAEASDAWSFQPIGYVRSVFLEKNGTPRQANVCQQSRAMIEIRKDVFTNPEHSLEGLMEYSHVWLLYVFHKNNSAYSKAKVAPPRLNGTKLGVFSTRSPYRPNPIGLSLVKLNYISGHCLHLESVDILDGTPVLDIKPYIPHYDNPQWDSFFKNTSVCSNTSGHSAVACKYAEGIEDGKLNNVTDASLLKATVPLESALESDRQCLKAAETKVVCASWIEKPPIPSLTVTFSGRAENDLKILTAEQHPSRSITGEQATREAIISILAADPRSTYRRQHCTDRLYYFSLDQLHVTCWFDDDVVEVLKIKMLSERTETKSSC